ncbi:uncharacterized protein Tco025E_09610 [Trypanosoma conorhini]|uniref:Uncharacterized protein n=1 Tax=Trypanosoma conorhini TaxID=83891 RepID=A0A422MUM5_9TRYP|nr:uncharacterized protein Tco025E_09610 [Trypanosoma conorhini]RNE96897.1 hypothetical protein Tco025E_09610 [Trypanosoma conorhini]
MSHGDNEAPCKPAEYVEGAGGPNSYSRNASSTHSLPHSLVPSEVYIPNRLGSTTMHLDGELRRDRAAVEKIVLYKEVKYNRINALNRFVIFLLCLLVPCVFCMAIGVGSTEWLVVAKDHNYRSIGLFFACLDGVAGLCLRRGSSWYPRVLRDRVTGKTICEASHAFVRAYITSMWMLGLVQFICIMLGLIVALRIANRPTRSHSSFVVMCLLLLALLCGVVVCVLFHFYTRCERQLCKSLRDPSLGCHVEYDWGFEVYIASICFNFCACITSLCLWSYPHSLRARTDQKYEQRREQERRRRERASTGAAEKGNPVNRLLRPILGEPEGPVYLTAEEFNITIEGADDWVYDDRSDLFYSFELDMFWDPLTRDYYSRELRSWQVTPQGMMGLRSAGKSRADG